MQAALSLAWGVLQAMKGGAGVAAAQPGHGGQRPRQPRPFPAAARSRLVQHHRKRVPGPCPRERSLLRCAQHGTVLHGAWRIW